MADTTRLIERIRTLAESHERTGERRTAATLRDAALALGAQKDTIAALSSRLRMGANP